MKTSNNSNHNQDLGCYKQIIVGRLFVLAVGKQKR